MPINLKNCYLLLVTTITLIAVNALGQNPSSCASVGSRANSNGQANNCPNVSGTAYASNFTGTTYATVPVTAKTGNIQFVYTGANPTLTPFAITRVWQTNPSTVLLTVQFGPASVPVVSGGNTQVNYCFYNQNLPAAGKLTFEFTDPQTGLVWGICSYDATCNSNCATVSNPPALLPVVFSYFKVSNKKNSMLLEWATAQEVNNKGFTIEKSANGADFSDAGFVPTSHAQGNSSTQTQYTFTDYNISSSHTWYRIQQTDINGNSNYSMVVEAVENQEAGAVAIHSSANRIAVTNLDPAVKYQLMVYDAQGRLLQQKNVSNTSSYNITGIPGRQQYFVSVVPANGAPRISKAVLSE